MQSQLKQTYFTAIRALDNGNLLITLDAVPLIGYQDTRQVCGNQQVSTTLEIGHVALVNAKVVSLLVREKRLNMHPLQTVQHYQRHIAQVGEEIERPGFSLVRKVTLYLVSTSDPDEHGAGAHCLTSVDYTGDQRNRLISSHDAIDNQVQRAGHCQCTQQRRAFFLNWNQTMKGGS